MRSWKILADPGEVWSAPVKVKLSSGGGVLGLLFKNVSRRKRRSGCVGKRIKPIMIFCWAMWLSDIRKPGDASGRCECMPVGGSVKGSRPRRKRRRLHFMK